MLVDTITKGLNVTREDPKILGGWFNHVQIMIMQYGIAALLKKISTTLMRLVMQWA